MDDINNKNKPVKARLFFGLNPPIDLKQHISKFVSNIQLHDEPNSSVKSVEIDNYHATLLFLGSVDEALIDSIVLEAKKIRCRKFTLKLNKIGHFKRSKALWLGSNNIPDELVYLHKSLIEMFGGFFNSPSDASNNMKMLNSFSLHVTILKKLRELNYISNILYLKKQLSHNNLMSWKINEFELLRSNIVNNQVQYETIYNFKLI